MTPQEINIAIAQSLGIKVEDIQDYHGSLDAIVPVVRSMPPLAKAEVEFRLRQILAGEAPTFSVSGWELMTATPEQWCEACLRANGFLQ